MASYLAKQVCVTWAMHEVLQLQPMYMSEGNHNLCIRVEASNMQYLMEGPATFCWYTLERQHVPPCAESLAGT